MIPVQIKCTNSEISLREIQEIEDTFYHAFDRFGHFIREAQFTLRDANGPKGGVDKICSLQLRFYPRGFAVVKNGGVSFQQAANVACDRMQLVASKRLSRRKSGPAKEFVKHKEEDYAYGN